MICRVENHPSCRANGSRDCAPDDRLGEAIRALSAWRYGLLRRFAPRNDYASPQSQRPLGVLLRRGRQGVPIHARLALEIVDRDVRVVPGQARTNAEALGEFGDLALGEPRLGRLPVLPEIDTSRAGIAVQIVLPDQSPRREIPVDGGRARSALDGLFFSPLRKIELYDDDAGCHDLLPYAAAARRRLEITPQMVPLN